MLGNSRENQSRRYGQTHGISAIVQHFPLEVAQAHHLAI
jgi:hypothetical protein